MCSNIMLHNASGVLASDHLLSKKYHIDKN